MDFLKTIGVLFIVLYTVNAVEDSFNVDKAIDAALICGVECYEKYADSEGYYTYEPWRQLCVCRNGTGELNFAKKISVDTEYTAYMHTCHQMCWAANSVSGIGYVSFMKREMRCYCHDLNNNMIFDVQGAHHWKQSKVCWMQCTNGKPEGSKFFYDDTTDTCTCSDNKELIQELRTELPVESESDAPYLSAEMDNLVDGAN